MDLRHTVSKLVQARKSIRAQIDPDAIYAFTRAVDELGYFDNETLKNEDLNHSQLVKEAITYLKDYLKIDPTDFVSLNNLGVLLANNGERIAPRRCFREALKLAPNDSNIHENIRILDIVSGKPKTRWHKVPDDTQNGQRTLKSFFDPHGM